MRIGVSLDGVEVKSDSLDGEDVYFVLTVLSYTLVAVVGISILVAGGGCIGHAVRKRASDVARAKDPVGLQPMWPPPSMAQAPEGGDLNRKQLTVKCPIKADLNNKGRRQLMLSRAHPPPFTHSRFARARVSLPGEARAPNSDVKSTNLPCGKAEIPAARLHEVDGLNPVDSGISDEQLKLGSQSLPSASTWPSLSIESEGSMLTKPIEPSQDVTKALECLHHIAGIMDARMPAAPGSPAARLQPRLMKASIRPGVNVAIADCTTIHSTVTVLLFPSSSRQRRHLRLYYQNDMRCFMPKILDNRDADDWKNRALGTKVHLPAHIYVPQCTPLAQALAQSVSVSDCLYLALTVVRELTAQLIAAHQRGVVLCDICPANVVRTALGSQKGWSLLEYGSVCRAGSVIIALPLRCTPPELARCRLRDGQAVARQSYDMWQLGVLLYQVATDRPYWPASMSGIEVVESLAEGTAPLPHVKDPVHIKVVQAILMRLLTRDAAQRITATQLKESLDAEEGVGTMAATLNPGQILQSQDISLEL